MLVTLVSLVYALSQQSAGTHTDRLIVHCAAGLQQPIREIAQRYEAEQNTSITLNIAGSGVLAAQMQLSGGDLYIPADDSYLTEAITAGLVGETLPLVTMRAVIVVQKGNPKNITSLDDLKHAGIRLSLADSTAAIGRYIEDTLTRSGDWQAIAPQIIVTKPTVNHVVEDVANTTVDATIAWDCVTANFQQLEIIRVPIFESKPRTAAVGIIRSPLTGSSQNLQNPKARLLMDYIARDSRSRSTFRNLGFTLAGEERSPHE